MEFITEWLSNNTSEWVAVFLASVMPISEIRGGLIIASWKDLPWIWAMLVGFIGNMLPIPFVLLFIQKIFKMLKSWNIKPIQKVVKFFEDRGKKKSAEAQKKSEWGKFIFLYVLVAIPLPGTGAWTGALVASFMDYPIKKSLPAITLGVFTAGIIISILFYFFPSMIG